ncbi:MAG: RDD family protein [Elusimicrobiota bacterium]
MTEPASPPAIPADRLQRLFAAVADACPLLLLYALRLHALARRSVGLEELVVVLFVLQGVVQFWLLSRRGQTLGKLIMGIRIVRTTDLKNGGFVKNVLERVAVGVLIGMIPRVGPFYALADILFIFRRDRRCLHDLIAGTRVVKIAP